MRHFRWLATATLILTAPSALAIEEPGFTVLRTFDTFEVRRYEPYVVAEVTVPGAANEAGNAGFQILAGYIFGKNKGGRKIEMTAPVAQVPVKIAMTAPVAQSATDGGYTVRFAMPREWTLGTLPEPVDARVVLREMPARTVAVIRYSGLWSDARYLEHLGILQAGMREQGLPARGEPSWARYDPPWTPWFMRRNEIWIETTAD